VFGFPQNRIVAAAVEVADDSTATFDFHHVRSPDKLAVQLRWLQKEIDIKNARFFAGVRFSWI
jgi:hypothetical protein